VNNLVYKILEDDAWHAARDAGQFNGSPDDVRDGYIHLSSAAQIAGTLQKHFAHVSSIVLVEFDAETLGSNLRYESSRGGALFPHLYAPLPTALARWAKRVGLGSDGTVICDGEPFTC